MSVTDADTPCRITPDSRTPCCGRIPMSIGHPRYVCRKCGVIYVDQAALVRTFFPGAHDVTRLTPRRFLTQREPSMFDGWIPKED